MDLHGIVLLHGYGVRGRTWDTMRSALGNRFRVTCAPDLNGASIADLIVSAEATVTACRAEAATPVVVVGHSLGAVLAAVATKNLGPTVVGAVILLAPPFGEGQQEVGGIFRFLLRHHLIPAWLIRPRFFSELTPRAIQKQVFADAVPERPELQAETMGRRWFHTELFDKPLETRSLVIASESDGIVPSSQSAAFASALGATLELLPATRGVGHDDLFASPEVAREIAGRIVTFLDSGPGGA